VEAANLRESPGEIACVVPNFMPFDEDPKNVDRVSGTVAERPGLATIKELLRAGDILVVWRLDRWAAPSRI
jgi:hypothetical protein